MSTAATTIPRPPSRLFTRIALPAIILLGTAGALAWSMWRTLAPATPVQVAQVVQRASEAAPPTLSAAPSTGAASSAASSAGSSAAPPATAPARLTGPAVQAPGWVEPAPFPVMVSALTSGTVKDVLVLEGDAVTKDQVLVRLYDEEQRIALDLADATLAELRAKHAELADELQRKTPLVDAGAVPAAEVARLKLRAEAAAASIRAAEAERAMKALTLARTEVRAPAAGVVMARLATPGAMAVAQDGKPLVELYDPASLQVRVDVPLADAGSIAPGQPAEIQVDVLPNHVFRGTVTRLVHQADIAKNTVQAKVRIDAPAPQLRPDMLARVRIFTRAGGSAGGAGSAGSAGTNSAGGGAGTSGNAGTASAPAASAAGSGELTVWAPLAALTLTGSDGSTATALVVVNLDGTLGTAELRIVTLSRAEADGWAETLSGLRPGDLLVTQGSPKPGTRVRVQNMPGTQAAATEVAHGDH